MYAALLVQSNLHASVKFFHSGTLLDIFQASVVDKKYINLIKACSIHSTALECMNSAVKFDQAVRIPWQFGIPYTKNILD